MQTSARLKDGLCVGAPADPDVVEEARRLSFKGAGVMCCAPLTLRRRTACTEQPTWRWSEEGLAHCHGLRCRLVGLPPLPICTTRKCSGPTRPLQQEAAGEGAASRTTCRAADTCPVRTSSATALLRAPAVCSRSCPSSPSMTASEKSGALPGPAAQVAQGRSGEGADA